MAWDAGEEKGVDEDAEDAAVAATGVTDANSSKKNCSSSWPRNDRSSFGSDCFGSVGAAPISAPSASD